MTSNSILSLFKIRKAFGTALTARIYTASLISGKGCTLIGPTNYGSNLLRSLYIKDMRHMFPSSDYFPLTNVVISCFRSTLDYVELEFSRESFS